MFSFDKDSCFETSIAKEPCFETQKHFSRLFKRTIILLAGPTSVGKTAVSLALAPKINGEIISVDSMQVYRNMDIGTAKVSLHEQAGIPHHLIDIRHVQEPFNVVDFYHEAYNACQSIFAKNKVPILVGGSGFYFHTFLNGPPKGPSSDPDVRRELEKLLQEIGIEALYKQLVEIDPTYAASITKNDKQKIIRALEIIQLTKKKVSEHQWETELTPKIEYSTRAWFLSKPKEILLQGAVDRCHRMMHEGLLEEVRQLIGEGILCNPSASSAIGYKQWIEYLQKNEPLTQFSKYMEDFIRGTKKYTKNQITWFKKHPIFREINIESLDIEEVASIIATDYLRFG
ncbi:tRNA (adenosine(37)-N6)-dimethylallyltransferase MiaA [Chlamydiifrater phoenicopteri]|uniref:tRNA (adenosine(37)-N6)-dimethylallyltransferase MiaA n=1 Tax=Chlamydiifrater phoenicopteri TaxID=2681469 RepID=UPI001BCDEE26|nr:tRNA (adenosine(37)-N6)-dimethylallyltransferase MiaA [Chlamydiifrater phoenicopteri]